MQQTSYVKFLRGTIDAYNELPRKDSDALYFVSEQPNSDFGYLYLGEKLIVGTKADTINLADLADIIINSELTNGSLLVYDESQEKWIAKPVSEAIHIQVMIGATSKKNGESGLVPAPLITEKNKYLRGDATWADPTAGLTAVVGNIINLGDKYYTPTTEQPTTIINEINCLNEKLTWGNIDN